MYDNHIIFLKREFDYSETRIKFNDSTNKELYSKLLCHNAHFYVWNSIVYVIWTNYYMLTSTF